MSTSETYRLNTPLVASEIIENEAVLIHFESGSYFSTDKVGATVLELIDKQVSVPQIVGTMVRTYAGEAVAIEKALRRFLSELRSEGLIVPTQQAPTSCADSAAEKTPVSPTGETPPFVDPVLHKFSDLQNLLMLDPIHDTEGWPAIKRDPSIS
jgi:hypothetical protein